MATPSKLEKLATKQRKKGCLDYYHKLRSYIAAHIEEASENKQLVDLAFRSYVRMNETRPIWVKDKTIKALTMLCRDQNPEKLDAPDPTVQVYSQIFNKFLRSKRRLYMCYDCGTMARTIFLAIMRAHRRTPITPGEQVSIQSQYAEYVEYPVSLSSLYRDIKEKKGLTLYLCSIGLGSMGHIFVLEKTARGAVRLFQSAHNSYTLVDHLEYEGYFDRPDQSIDVKKLCRDIRYVLDNSSEAWSHGVYKRWLHWFHFMDEDSEHPFRPTSASFMYAKLSV